MPCCSSSVWACGSAPRARDRGLLQVAVCQGVGVRGAHLRRAVALRQSPACKGSGIELIGQEGLEARVGVQQVLAQCRWRLAFAPGSHDGIAGRNCGAGRAIGTGPGANSLRRRSRPGAAVSSAEPRFLLAITFTFASRPSNVKVASPAGCPEKLGAGGRRDGGGWRGQGSASLQWEHAAPFIRGGRGSLIRRVFDKINHRHSNRARPGLAKAAQVAAAGTQRAWPHKAQKQARHLSRHRNAKHPCIDMRDTATLHSWPRGG